MVARLGFRIGCQIATVMAGCTISGCDRACSSGMAHRRRFKGDGVFVAYIALGRRWDMRSGLALGSHTMARRATAGHRRADQCVIKNCTSERRIVFVTNVAL